MFVYSHFIKSFCLLLLIFPLVSCSKPTETTAQEEKSLPPAMRIPYVDIQPVTR